MSLHWVFGGSGYGKSHYVYNEIMKQSVRNPLGKYIVIVPEQFTMQTQKDMVMLSKAKGIMNIDVLSFVRLAYRALGQTKALDKPLLEDEGKGMIVRRILKEHAGEWKTFGNNINRVGFVEEIKSIVTEFVQYRMDDDKFKDMLNGVRDKGILSSKIEDVGLVYKYYREYMEERYISSEELLSILACYVPESEMIKGSVVCIDGFTGFTPVQYELLGELMKVCSDIYITVTIDNRTQTFGKARQDELFYMSRTYINKCMKIASQAGVYVEDPVWACNSENKAWRFASNPELGMLEANIFREKTAKDPLEVNERIKVYEAVNPYEEVEYCVWQIGQLIRKEGLRYRDIAIITGDTETYSRLFKDEFEKVHIPYFTDSNRSVPDNPFVDMIMSVLALVLNDFDYHSVMSLLRNGIVRDYLGFDSRMTDELDCYLLACGVRGIKLWGKPWNNSKKSRTDIDVVNEARQKMLDVFLNTCDKLKSAGTVTEYCLSLYDFISEHNMSGILKAEAQRYETIGDHISKKEYEQIYTIVMKLMEQMAELMGGDELSLGEFTEIIKTGFNEAEVGVIPPGVDTVIVGDITRTRLKDIKVLFFAGVNDGIVPQSIKSGGFLSDMERELLAENGAELAPTLRERIFNDRFYIYLALTRPSDRLYISYCAKSCGGDRMQPSPVLEDIAGLYSGGYRLDSGYAHWSDEAGIGNDFGRSEWINGLRKYAAGNMGEKDVESWINLHGSIIGSPGAEDILDSAFYMGKVTPLTEELAKRLYGENIEGSVSRLELFASCAYAHFLKYGLLLDRRKEYGLEVPELGTIFHNIIEEFSKRLEYTQKSWDDVDGDLIGVWTSQITERICNEFGHGIMNSDARSEYMKKRIERISAATINNLSEQMRKGKFRAESYEVQFNDAGGNSVLNIALDNGSVMKLGGRIDRLDVCEDGKAVLYKVIDYKSGNREFDLTRLYHGITMQLIVYLEAARDIESRNHPDKLIIPAGAFYYHIDDPVVDEEENDNESDINDKINREYRMRGPVNGDKNIPCYIDSNLGSIEGGIEAGTQSDVVNIKVGKNGAFLKSSEVYSGKQFEYMMRHTREKIREAGNGICMGDIDFIPYRLDKESPCKYCEFKSVCGFDTRLSGYIYRKLDIKDEKDIWKEWEELYGGEDEFSSGTKESD